MQFRRLEIRSFLAIEKAEIDFESGIHFLSGLNHDMSTDEAESNGAGKSSIFDALYWALFGTILRDGAKADDVVNRTIGKNCKVVLFFQCKGVDYTIERYRQDDEQGNAIEFFEGAQRITQHTARETQALIAQRLPITEQVFNYGVMVGQGMPNRFLNLSETAKQELLFSIVDVSMYDRALEATKEEERQSNASVIRLTSSLTMRTQQLSELHREMDRQRSALSDFDARESAVMQNILDQIKSCDANIAVQEDNIARFVSTAKSSNIVKADLTKFWNELQDALLNHSGRKSFLESSLDNWYGQVAKWEKLGPECPLCKQRVDPAISKGYIKECSAQISSSELDMAQALELVKATNEAINQIKSDMFRSEQTIDEMLREERRSHDLIDRHRRTKETLSQQYEGRSQQRGLIEDRFNVVQKAIETLSNGVSEMQTQAEEAIRVQKHWMFWKNSIPNLRASAVGSVLEFINGRLAEYMDIFTGGAIGMRLYQEEYGIGSKIKVDVRTPAGSYGLSSGGEKRRIDVALYLALSDLMRTTSGVQCNLVLADEIMDGLSLAGVRKFLEILRTKAQQGSSVWVISHNPAVSFTFDSVYVVERKNGRANIHRVENH